MTVPYLFNRGSRQKKGDTGKVSSRHDVEKSHEKAVGRVRGRRLCLQKIGWSSSLEKMRLRGGGRNPKGKTESKKGKSMN